jgi:hypothetical protein
VLTVAIQVLNENDPEDIRGLPVYGALHHAVGATASRPIDLMPER